MQPKIDKPPPEKQLLPMFRQDLQLFAGPIETDGSPTYNLFDPVRAQYFKINWLESLVLKMLRPGMTMKDLIHAIEQNSTVKPTSEDLMNLFRDAAANNLLAGARSSETVEAEAQKLKIGWFKWLIYHYLYIRIPIINPDRFLTRTLHYVTPLFSPWAMLIYSAITVAGLFQLIVQFDEFLHTFPYFFNAQGAVIYAVAITCVKIIHEFAHAYVAKYYNTYVPAMGIALIVFWPVLYTNVTDSWRLAKRSQRLAISFAGIAVELTVAGMATLGWAMTSPGLLQSVFFVISSATWISTLVVNLNPALRFDGYYILCDLWGMDNLQPRAFAITRWQLRKWLLGIEVPPPEENLSQKKIIMLMVYTLYTWIYRLILYTAIAIFIYLQFTKVLGIFLFIAEIGIFIIWPLASELNQINKLRPYIHMNKRLIATLTVLTIFLLWFFLPWPHRASFPAITTPFPHQIVYVPYEGIVKAIYIQRGDRVEADQPLVQLFSQPLLTEIAAAQADRNLAEKQVMIAEQSEEDRPHVAEKKAEVKAYNEKIFGLKKVLEHMTLTADFSGTVYHWDETLRVGESLAKDQVLGKIANLNALEVTAYVPETYLNDIVVGQEVIFRVYSSLEKVKAHITKIHPVRSQHLTYPQLASIHSGEIPVVQNPNSNDLIIVESYFTVTATIDDPDVALQIGERGHLDVRGVWRSYFMSLLRYLHSLFWREATL